MSAKQRTELMELHANVIMENYGRDERKHFMFEMEDIYTKKDDFLCALENHAYYSILVLVCMGRKRQLAKMVEEFWVEYQEANAGVEKSEDEDSDDDDDDDDDDAPEPVCNPDIDEFWKDMEEKIEKKEVCADCHENMDCCVCKDFTTEWNSELKLDERVALLSKTFDNKEEITIETLAKHITHEPDEDYVVENDMSCAQFFWDYEDERIDNLASEEFRYSLEDGKKNLMWVEKLKEVAGWKNGEYIYAYTKTNADGYYNVFYKKNKENFTWFNMIVEPSGYVVMETFNHYSSAEDEDIKFGKLFIRVDSIYNDKIADSK